MKNIIHLSDLHLSNSNSLGFYYKNAAQIIDKLIDDVKSIEKSRGIKFDTIFFTGDLAFSGGADEYLLFEENIQNKLINELSIEIENFYIIPGNHDVSRKNVKIVEKKVRETTVEDLNELFNAIDDGIEGWDRLKNYFEYEEKMNPVKSNFVLNGKLLKIKKISSKLYLVFVNSAWLAQDDKDKENLFITPKQIEKIINSKIPRDASLILLTHHPIDWLNPEDRDQFSSFLEKRVSMMCFGHMHSFKQKSEASFKEDITLFLQAGTLDTWQEYTGYSCILLNNTNSVTDGTVVYRKYNKTNENFMPWTDYGNNGQFDFSTIESVNFDSEKFVKVSTKLLYEADKDLLINLGFPEEKKKSLRKFFSEPNFSAFEVTPHLNTTIKETGEIIHSNDSLIIVGGANSGRTSVLKYLFAKGLELQTHRNFEVFYFFLDLKKEAINTKGQFLQALVNQYFDEDLDTSFEEKIKRMVQAGNATIFIDNIDFPSAKSQQSVYDFIKSNKNCRYIFSSKFDYCNTLDEALAQAGLSNYKCTSLGGLKRKNVRDIVSRWDDSININSQNSIYNEINKLIDNSQLPHNYFIYTMLLTIYEIKSEFEGILTEADIIENFIEILLKKHCINTPKTKPQYKELLHFLGYLSKEMYVSKMTKISYNEVLRLALQFNSSTMYTYSVEYYIHPLIESGIIKREREFLYFSQPSFAYYSLSYFMKHDEALKHEIFQPQNMLEYDKVIEYYSAQNASSFEALEIIDKELTTQTFNLLQFYEKTRNINVNDFDLNNIKETPLLDSFKVDATKFAEEVEKFKADREKDDERLDEICPLNPRDHDNIDIFKRERNVDNIMKLYVNTLSLYARVFRNTELSMDRDKTLTVFNKIIDGYIFFIKTFLISIDVKYIIPILERQLNAYNESDTEITNEDILEILTALKAILPIVRSASPNYVQTLIFHNITSKKPRIENIIKLAKDDTDDSLRKALLSYTLMDLRDENIRECVTELLKDKNSLVAESLFIKIQSLINTNYDLRNEDIRYLKASLKNMVIQGKVPQRPNVESYLKKLN
ncbi:metallophosphoesterase [Cronobacter turicensis]|uniref:metallophosphoesterase n=1 Tax=Cronobacter turicensis TaxID=413502 RepID=UPI0024AFE9C8|nr:metallophosphoesterase [Cronobacter turicensis]MDI7404455.1 metallophosphoesterase [Cronobacter turicensis]